MLVVELAEARVDPDRERMRAQEARAEAVDGRDPRAVELAREVVAAARVQRRSDARPQLAGGLARVGDHEHRLDVEALVADGADEALDEHRRLARARARRDEDLARRLDRCSLLGVHVRDAPRGTSSRGRTRTGTLPPFGSWRTSPARMRCAYPRPRSRAVSTSDQNSSSVEVVVALVARQVVGRARVQQAAGDPRPGERAVDAAERLDPDEVAQHEHVERDLELQLLVDLLRRMRAAARLVVLHDPARAVRVDVDPVDLAAQVEIVAEVQAALQLGRRAVGAERDLEPPRHELQRRCGLVADEALEIAEEALVELGLLQVGEVEPDAAAQRVVEAAPEEADRLLDVLRGHAVVPELLRQRPRRTCAARCARRSRAASGRPRRRSCAARSCARTARPTSSRRSARAR